jgi:hypothetical protein
MSEEEAVAEDQAMNRLIRLVAREVQNARWALKPPIVIDDRDVPVLAALIIRHARCARSLERTLS